MKIKLRIYMMVVLLVALTQQMMAQQKISGRVIDVDGFAVPYASVQYRGHRIAVSSDGEGRFSIEKHEGWMLTVSALSYKTQTVKVDANTNFLEIKLKDDSRRLNEVVVKSKRGKYKRKDNPAVELMRRVIAAKKKTDLANHPYYQYDKYQKITLALNDLSKEQLEGKFFSKRQYLLDQVEKSPYNGKLTLPVLLLPRGAACGIGAACVGWNCDLCRNLPGSIAKIPRARKISSRDSRLMVLGR